MELKLTTEQLNLIKKGYWIITRKGIDKGDKVFINDELCGIIDIVEDNVYFSFRIFDFIKDWKFSTLDLITEIEKQSLYSSSDIYVSKIEQFTWFKEPKTETILAIAEPKISASPNEKKKSKKVKDNE